MTWGRKLDGYKIYGDTKWYFRKEREFWFYQTKKEDLRITKYFGVKGFL